MANTISSTTIEARATQATPARGLSLVELEAEAVAVLPEREEMSGCHRWYSWHPCYEYSPCYDFNPCYDYNPCYNFPSSSFVR